MAETEAASTSRFSRRDGRHGGSGSSRPGRSRRTSLAPTPRSGWAPRVLNEIACDGRCEPPASTPWRRGRRAPPRPNLHTKWRRRPAERIREERARQKEMERAAKLKAATEVARQRLTVEALLILWERHKLPVWSERSQPSDPAARQRLRAASHRAEGRVPDLRLADALAVVDPLISDGKIETARRVCQRLSEMLDYAAAHHHVSNNVVRLAAADLKDRFKRAHRDHPEKSHPTIPMAELPQLLRAMRTYVGTPVTRSLLWLIALTACRTGEARYARWSEFELDAGSMAGSPRNA